MLENIPDGLKTLILSRFMQLNVRIIGLNHWILRASVMPFGLFNSSICWITNHIIVRGAICCQDPVIPHVVLCVHITKSQWKSLKIKNVVSNNLYKKRHNICSLNKRISETQKFLTMDPLPK